MFPSSIRETLLTLGVYFFYKQFAQSYLHFVPELRYNLSPRIPNNPVTIYQQTLCHVDNFSTLCTSLFGYVIRQPLFHYRPVGGCQVFYPFNLTYPGLYPYIPLPVHPMGVSPLPYMGFSTQKPPTIP